MRIRTPLWANDVWGDRFAIIEAGMPLGRSVSKNIRDLVADNKKKGKARGAGGKKRPMKRIVAIALSAAGKKKKSR